MDKKDLIKLAEISENDGFAIYAKAAELGGATKEQILKAWYEYCETLEG